MREALYRISVPLGPSTPMASVEVRLLRWGQTYVDEGAEAYERRYEQSRLLALKSCAKQLGYALVQTT
jgi:hypothetical protein